ncbi:MAG: ATP-binding protein [Verrucomicrobiota bacterium]
MALVIQDQGQNCLVYVMGAAKTNDLARFLDARVKVRGINASKIVKGKLEAASVFVPGMSEVTILAPPSINPWQLPVTSVDDLLHKEFGGWTNRPVRLRGLITAYQPGEYALIKDSTGVLKAQVIQVNEAQVGQRVNAWGFLAGSPEPILKDAYFEIVASSGARGEVAAESKVTSLMISNTNVITHVSEIMKLRAQASLNIPVRLTGVMTYADPEWRVGFFQDETRGIFVDLKQPDVRAGQWVELSAQTDPGGFAPQLINATARILGQTNLPVPVMVMLDDLSDGHLDAQWVQVDGVVRRVTKQEGRVRMELTTPKGRFNVLMSDFTDHPAPSHLLDALVSVRGACGALVNARGQLSGITLHVPSLEQIKTLEAPPSDPFEVTTTPAIEVTRFNPDRLAGRRVKVSGVVTLSLQGQGHGFWVQDRSGGIRVHSTQTNELKTGDAVEVLGFPAMGDFSPRIEEATYRKTGSAPLPTPLETTAEQLLLQGTNDATVVQIQARLLQGVARAIRPKLVLQNGATIFSATMVNQAPDDGLYTAQAGSLLRITGICQLQGGESHEPESFRLLLSGSKDIVLLEAPSWWTPGRALMLVGGMTLAIAASAAWVSVLRSQVKQRTRKLSEEIEERKAAEEALKKAQRELVDASRLAGMAEVATTVLHNVGNVLNSVNVSATLVADKIKQSRVSMIPKVAAMMKEHAADLGEFLTSDVKGRQVPLFVENLGEHLTKEQGVLLEEVASLQKHVGHIKEIVSMQQGYAKVSGVFERLPIVDLIEDALRLNAGALGRHEVQVAREYQPELPLITVDRHKTLQILVNLIRNAQHACDEAGSKNKKIILRIESAGQLVRISVIDNGIGIPPENLNRIFNHGFTTRKNGHGFGLHSGALAAKEMGGALRVSSGGTGQGACFILELPVSLKDL